MTVAVAQTTFGARALTARQVHADAVTAVLERCKAAMRQGQSATTVATLLRSSYSRLAQLAAAVEVIEDQDRDPVPLVVEEAWPARRLGQIAPARPAPPAAPAAMPAGAVRADARRAQRMGLDSRSSLLFDEGLAARRHVTASSVEDCRG